MSYVLADIKKLYRSSIIRWMLIILLFVMIADPISVYIINGKYDKFFEVIGSNPFQFWLLINSASWGNNLFYTIFWVLPILSTGLIFYNEQQSSMRLLLVIRGNGLKYYLAKIFSIFIVTFLNFFVLLIINIGITYLIFPTDAPLIKQYMYLIPHTEMFSYSFYQKSPLSMEILYAFIDAFAIALLSLFALAFHAMITLKNKYIAILTPFIVLYLINYIISLCLKDNLNYNLGVIVQPRAASAIVNTISTSNVLLIFGIVLIIDVILLIFGHIRSKEIL